MSPYGLDLSYPPNIPWASNIFTDSEPPFTWLIGVLVRGTPYPSLAPYWDLPAQQLDNQWDVLRAAFSGRTNERPGADFVTSGPMTSLKKLHRMAQTHRQTDGRTWRGAKICWGVKFLLFCIHLFWSNKKNIFWGGPKNSGRKSKIKSFWEDFFLGFSKKNWCGDLLNGTSITRSPGIVFYYEHNRVFN